MICQFKSFVREETGAVTVDWVVLTALAVGLAIAAFTVIGTQSRALATTTANVIQDRADD